MSLWQDGFKVGRTLNHGWHDQGTPCIIVDGDSVLCVFPSSNGEEQARIVCNALNAAHAANKDLQSIS